MLRRALRFLQLSLRFGFPLMLVVVVAAPFVENAYPWTVADAHLPSRPGQLRVLVGAGYSSRSSFDALENVTERHADYVYYPEVLKSKSMYRISLNRGGAVTITTEHFSVLATVIGFSLTVALIVVAWVRPLAPKVDGRAT